MSLSQVPNISIDEIAARMNQDELKRQAALRALQFVPKGEILGVGTGSTVNFFIDALASIKQDIPGAVSSSVKSTERLLALGIPVLDLNQVLVQGRKIPLYVDGADEANEALHLIKGGGGALTREKIIAQACTQFVCIVDQSKVVQRLGHFPLPVEVIPMAQELVASQLRLMGASPKLREGFVTDNGNVILDAHGLQIDDALSFENMVNQWPGVVTVGLFARRCADRLIISTPDGLQERG
jgi:ribose 5-phosphate isomerase A